MILNTSKNPTSYENPIKVNEQDQELLNNYDARKSSGFYGNIVNGKVDAANIADLNRAGSSEADRAAYAIAMNKDALHGIGSRRHMRQLQQIYNFDLGGRRNSNAVLKGIQVGMGNRQDMSDSKYIRGRGALDNLKGSYVGSYRDQNGNIVSQNTGFGLNGDYITGNFGFYDKDGNSMGGMFQKKVNTGVESIFDFNGTQSKTFGENQIKDRIFQDDIKKKNLSAFNELRDRLKIDPESLKSMTQEGKNTLINELIRYQTDERPEMRYASGVLIKQIDPSYKNIATPSLDDYLKNLDTTLFSNVSDTFNNNYTQNKTTGIWQSNQDLALQGWAPGNNVTVTMKNGGNVKFMQNGGKTDQRKILGAVAKLALMQCKNDSKKALALIPQIMQGLQKKDQKIAQAVQQVMQQSDEKELLQLGQQLEQAQTQQARNGAKLDYAKFLNNSCPDGYEIKYFKKGGLMQKGCVPCMEKAKAALAAKGCKTKKKAICKNQDGGSVPNEKNIPNINQQVDLFYKQLQQKLMQEYQNKYLNNQDTLIKDIPNKKSNETSKSDLISSSNNPWTDTVFISQDINGRRKLLTLKSKVERQKAVEDRLSQIVSNAIKQSKN